MLPDLPIDHDINHLRGALRILKARGVPFDFAIDGGAHKGIWTRILEDEFKDVIAIEPFHETKCKNQLKFALGGESGYASMKAGTDNTGQYHVVEGNDVQVITIDSLGLKPDFIKLDVEGMELPTIKGAMETINKYHPAIMVEMNGLSERYGYTDKDLVEYLNSIGYKQEGKWNKDYLFCWYDQEFVLNYQI